MLLQEHVYQVLIFRLQELCCISLKMVTLSSCRPGPVAPPRPPKSQSKGPPRDAPPRPPKPGSS